MSSSVRFRLGVQAFICSTIFVDRHGGVPTSDGAYPTDIDSVRLKISGPYKTQRNQTRPLDSARIKNTQHAPKRTNFFTACVPRPTSAISLTRMSAQRTPDVGYSPLFVDIGVDQGQNLRCVFAHEGHSSLELNELAFCQLIDEFYFSFCVVATSCSSCTKSGAAEANLSAVQPSTVPT